MHRVWDKSKPPRGPFALNTDCPQAKGLVCWYPFGVAGGSYVADQVGKTHLTVTGGRFSGGQYGEPVIVLNGSTDNAKISSSPISIHPLSLASWVRPDSLSGYGIAVAVSKAASASSDNRAHLLIMQTTGTVQAWATGNTGGGSASYTTAALSVGKWGLAGAIFSGLSSRTAYLNGVAGTTDTTALGSDFSGLDTVSLGLEYSNSATAYPFNGAIGESCIWNIDVGVSMMARMADPDKRFELWYPLRSKKWISIAAGGTSVALTGTSGTGGVGNLTTTLSVPLTNVVGTGAVGNLTTTLSAPITGTAGTGAAGNITTTLAVPLTNVVGTGAVGTITTALSVALTGVTSTGAAGTVTPSAGTSIALTGVAGTGAVGNLTTTLSTSVTGVVGTGAVGTVTPGAVMALTGVAGTGAVGSVATTLSTSVTGVAATGAVGNLTTALSTPVTGTAGTGAVGSVVPGGTVINLSGVSGAGAVGTFASTLATQLTGIYAPGLVGNVSYVGAPALVVFPPGSTFVASTWQETRVASVRSETTL